MTALGNDPFSAEMVSAWRAEGVGTDLVLRVPGALPGLYLIQTDGAGERRFSYWRNSAPARRLLALPEAPLVLAALSRFSVIYLSGITLSLYAAECHERLFAAIDTLRASGCRVVFDTNFRSHGWRDREVAKLAYARMLRRTDIVFAGMEDLTSLLELSPDQTQSFLRSAGPREIVLKLPSFACLVDVDGVESIIDAVHVGEVVDTTAAGDSFAAGYLSARMSGAAAAQAALAGHRVASLVISHPGAIIAKAAWLRAYEP